MLSDQESLAVEEILTLLYCCPSFQDFRKPVEILYPALWEQYQKVIATPVDLGNLLLNSKRGLLKINELREYMQLVSKNCIKFNGNASIMVNIANHYLTYATALFEEILNLPFKDISQNFKARRIAKRIERYEFVKSEPLNNRELKRIRDVLHDLQPPEALKAVVQQIIGTVSHILFENAEVTEDSSGHLWDLLLPVVEATTSATEDTVIRDIAIIPANCKVHRDYQTYLKQLDDAVGVLSAMMQERLLRGNTYSTRWLRPMNSVIWAQPPKDSKGRSPWWPAFVVASASKLFPMHPEVSQLNLDRITADVKNQLYKLRPRGNQHTPAPTAEDVTANVDTSNATPDGSIHGESKTSGGVPKAKAVKAELSVPEGYLLIEFFGSHDFGWIKADLCGPFKVWETEDGVLMHSPPPMPPVANSGSHTSSGVTQAKTCSPEILKEAMNAAQYLEDLVLTAGEAIAEDLDLAVPTMSELEESLMVNESYQGLTMLSKHSSSTNGHCESVAKTAGAGSGSSSSAAKRKSHVDKAAGGGGGDDSRKKFKTSVGFSAAPSANGQHIDTSKYTVNNYPGMGSVVNHCSLSADELNRCIINNVFKVSKCSLPPRKGVLMSSLGSTSAAEGESMENAATVSGVAGGGRDKKRYYKENAIHRCKAVAFWMEKMRPLNLSHLTVTKQNPATLAIAVKNNAGHSGLPSSSSGGSSGVANTAAGEAPMVVEGATTVETTASTADADDQGYWQQKDLEEQEAVNSVLARIKAASAAASKQPEKRKYVFKHNKAAETVKTVEIGSFKKTAAGGGGAGDDEGGGGAAASKRVYTGTHLTSSGTNCFNLETGCSRFYIGDGSIYTRRVKLDSDVFFLESRSREKRKALLREELAYIAKLYENIQEIAKQRKADEALNKPKKRSALSETDDGSSDERSDDEEEDEEDENSEGEEEPRTHIQQAIKAQMKNVVSPIKNLPGKVGLIAQLERQRQQQLASKAPVSISNMLPI